MRTCKYAQKVVSPTLKDYCEYELWLIASGARRLRDPPLAARPGPPGKVFFQKIIWPNSSFWAPQWSLSSGLRNALHLHSDTLIVMSCHVYERAYTTVVSSTEGVIHGSLSCRLKAQCPEAVILGRVREGAGVDQRGTSDNIKQPCCGLICSATNLVGRTCHTHSYWKQTYVIMDVSRMNNHATWHGWG